MSAVQLKSISIVELEEANIKSVYVLNQTSGFEKGNVIISVQKKNGQGSDTVLIQNTFLPINLTDQVSKQQLLDSSDFRSALKSRRLRLVCPKEAEKVLSTKVAQKELEKLYKETEVFRNNVIDMETDGTEYTDNTTGMQDLMQSVADGEGDSPESKVRSSVLQLVADLENKESDQDSAISTLRNMENVTRHEYRFIYKSVSSKHKELIKYAKEQHEIIKAKKKAKKINR